jgi:hypothetical protein
VPDAERGGTGPVRAGPPPHDPLDGRLDLDALDAPVDLDVIGTEPAGGVLPERLRGALERSGVAPFVRRHRHALAVGSVTAALALGLLGSWWLARPAPLPAAPLLLVKASGPDSTQVRVRPTDRGLVDLTLDVAVASVERPGVAVALLSLTGPALSPVAGAAASPVDTATGDTVTGVSAALDCASPSAGADALRADPSDFGVEVRRTAPEGEVRVDTVPLVGAQRLAQVVRGTCLQAAAGRELTTTALTATPLEGVAAADLEVAVHNGGTREWPELRVSLLGQPWVVGMGSATDLAPGATATLRARLWLQDCADPSAALAGGLQVRTSFAAVDTIPYSADNAGNTFRLPVDAAARKRMTDAFAAVCSSAVPAATATAADVHSGATDTSAGTIDLTLTVHAKGAALLEVDAGGPTAGGELTPIDAPVHLDHGTGVLHATWTLPGCSDLLVAGIPRFGVALVSFDASGGERRPYLMPVRGEPLRVALVRVCGEAARTLVP